MYVQKIIKPKVKVEGEVKHLECRKSAMISQTSRVRLAPGPRTLARETGTGRCGRVPRRPM
ncbi:Uncharacterized protein DAT39_009952, partial [Clarias magur]